MGLSAQHSLARYFDMEERNKQLPLTLWFDSAKEGKDFASLLEINRKHFDSRGVDLGAILRSSAKYVKHKSDYRKGIYWPLVDIQRMITTEDKVKAPNSITKLSQWQHHDFIIAKEYDPLLAVEVTEHILTWNNVAQRLPRLSLSASYNVPTIILQKIGAASKDKYKGWFLQSLCRCTEIFKCPCLALLFDDESREQSERLLSDISCKIVDYVCFKDEKSFDEFRDLILKIGEENAHMAKSLYDVHPLTSCRWLSLNSKEVRVKIGVRPEDSMWKTKGTGGLDPYPGLVLMADLLLCRTGPKKSNRSRRLIVEFRYIKEDFWWFKRFPEELYLQLLIDEEKRIADEVVFNTG
jgi:hypothetical protein